IKQHQSKPSLDLHEKGLNSLFSTPVVSNADFFVTDDDSSSSSFFEELKQRPEPTTRSPSHSHHSLDYDSQSPPKNPTGGKHLEYQGSKEESEFVVDTPEYHHSDGFGEESWRHQTDIFCDEPYSSSHFHQTSPEFVRPRRSSSISVQPRQVAFDDYKNIYLDEEEEDSEDFI
ncbi:hypothetical protein ADUPG1_006039, partial [Aduncisulcus paluster]